MKLTEQQQQILDGAQGETMAKVMKTMVMYGEAFEAEKMVPVTSKHNHLVTSFGLKVSTTPVSSANTAPTLHSPFAFRTMPYVSPADTPRTAAAKTHAPRPQRKLTTKPIGCTSTKTGGEYDVRSPSVATSWSV